MIIPESAPLRRWGAKKSPFLKRRPAGRFRPRKVRGTDCRFSHEPQAIRWGSHVAITANWRISLPRSGRRGQTLKVQPKQASHGLAGDYVLSRVLLKKEKRAASNLTLQVRTSSAKISKIAKPYHDQDGRPRARPGVTGTSGQCDRATSLALRQAGHDVRHAANHRGHDQTDEKLPDGKGKSKQA